MKKIILSILIATMMFTLTGCYKRDNTFFANPSSDSYDDLEILVDDINESITRNYINDIYHPWHSQSGSPGNMMEAYNRTDQSRYQLTNNMDFYNVSQASLVTEFLSRTMIQIKNSLSENDFKEGIEININDDISIVVNMNQDDLHISYIEEADASKTTQSILVLDSDDYNDMEIVYDYNEIDEGTVSKAYNISLDSGEETSLVYVSNTITYTEISPSNDLFSLEINSSKDYKVVTYDSLSQDLYEYFSTSGFYYTLFDQGHSVVTFDILDQDRISYNLHNVYGWDKLQARSIEESDEINIYMSNNLITDEMEIHRLLSDQYYLILDIKDKTITDDLLSLNHLGLTSFMTKDFYDAKLDKTLEDLLEGKPVDTNFEMMYTRIK